MLAWALDWDREWSTPIDSEPITMPKTSPTGVEPLNYRRSIVCCGPQGLMDAAVSVLATFGIDSADVVCLDA
jgi:hypothetical protein